MTPSGSLNRLNCGDLKQDGFVARDLELVEDLIHLLRRQIAVFVAQGIDGRIDQELRHRERLGELR